MNGRRVGRSSLAALATVLVLLPVPAVAADDDRTQKVVKDPAGDVRLDGSSGAERVYGRRLLRATDIREVQVAQTANRRAFVRLRLGGGLPKRARRVIQMELTTNFTRHQEIAIVIRGRAKRARITATYPPESYRGFRQVTCFPRIKYTRRQKVLTFAVPYKCSWWTVRRIFAEASTAPQGWPHLDAWDPVRAPARLTWLWE